jgi:uncharacterized protein YdeI (YjbR/CyaY-like superfamily)
MNIGETFHANHRAEWRDWLSKNHAEKKEIWLLKSKGTTNPTYLETVQEALCFGWIDGIAKRLDAQTAAQRFTPRRAKSHWTELNKERARRLIAQGRMTEAGRMVLPDLSLEAFQIAPDILQALQADSETWQHFQDFPEVYQRIRIGYIEEVRRQPTVFQSRLNNFLQKTKRNQQFGGTE